MTEPQERILRPFKFWTQLERYTMLPADLTVLQKQGNLEDALVKVMMLDYDRTFDGIDLSSTNKVFPGGEADFKKLLSEGAEKQYREQAKDLVPTMCNLVAVMACTIFDTYLQDCLEVLLLRDPKVIKALAHEKDLTVFEVIDLQTSNGAVAVIVEKILRRFDHEGIEGKLKLLERAGVEVGRVFSTEFVLDEAKADQSKAREELVELYNRRNGIVHQHDLAYRNPQEVGKVDVLLHRLILSFAVVISKKWPIEVDFFMFAIKPTDPRLQQGDGQFIREQVEKMLQRRRFPPD